MLGGVRVLVLLVLAEGVEGLGAEDADERAEDVRLLGVDIDEIGQFLFDVRDRAPDRRGVQPGSSLTLLSKPFGSGMPGPREALVREFREPRDGALRQPEVVGVRFDADGLQPARARGRDR